jgi:hypothetical protein
MIRTGVFTLVNGESRLSDGTLLAVCSDPSPLAAARPFLLGRGCQPNHSIEVSGAVGPVDGVTAFCLADARPIPAPTSELVAATALTAPKTRKSQRKVAKKGPRKLTKTTKGKQDKPKKKAKTTRRKPAR